MENRNVYKGHRYVPKIMGEWNQEEMYEGLSIVTHQGASYTSKKRVPIGIDLSDEEYWAVTGNYNAQVETYRQDVKNYKQETVEMVEDFSENLTTKLGQIVLNIHSIGGHGNGVDSDVNAILEGSQDGVILGFPDGTYVIDSHMHIENKNIKWVALGSNVKFLDKGKEVLFNDVGETTVSNGIEFKNCNVELKGFSSDTIVGRSLPIPTSNANQLVPVFSFTGGKVKLTDISTIGKVGSYVSGVLEDPAVSNPVYEQMRASYFRFYQCESVELEDYNQLSGSGGGEFLNFYQCKKVRVRNSGHDQGGSSTTFWSFAKVIDCTDVLLEDIEIDSSSTGSLMDVSGKHIVYDNVNVDYPAGKYIDITQEWGYGNVDTERVTLKNGFTNADRLVITATHQGTNIKDINELIIDNMEWEPLNNDGIKYYIDSRYIKNVTIKNSPIKNMRNINAVLDNELNPVLDESNLTLDNVSITSDFQLFGNQTKIEANGNLTIENSSVNQNRLNRFIIRDVVKENVNTSEHVVSIKNTTFKDTEIAVGANVVFENCSFDNVNFIDEAQSKYPSLEFYGCSFTYSPFNSGSNFVPFQFNTLNRLVLKNTKKFSGSAYNTSNHFVINPYQWDVLDGVYIDDLEIDLKRLTHSGAVQENGYELLRDLRETDIGGHKTIKLENVHVGENMRSAIRLWNLADNTTLDVSNSSISPKNDNQLIFKTADDKTNIRLISMNNRFNGDSYYTMAWALNETDYETLVETGNVEW